MHYFMTEMIRSRTNTITVSKNTKRHSFKFLHYPFFGGTSHQHQKKTEVPLLLAYYLTDF